MTITAIAAAVPRRRTTVRGQVLSVVSLQRPWVRTDATIDDGTGSLLLRFLGRSAVPGLIAGRQVVAQGTPGFVRGVLVMLNPIYQFTAMSGPPPPAGSRFPEQS
jgi:hypothetical protein